MRPTTHVPALIGLSLNGGDLLEVEPQLTLQLSNPLDVGDISLHDLVTVGRALLEAADDLSSGSSSWRNAVRGVCQEHAVAGGW